MIKLTTAEYAGPAKNSNAHAGGWMYIAIHNTANDASARGEASYALWRTDDVSCHVVTDQTTTLQLLSLDRASWHAGSAWGNSNALSFEFRGKNTWSEGYWRTVIDQVAPTIAECCRLYSIPVRRLTVEQARKKVMKGFVTHDDMRQAWGGTTHTDPGPNFPMQYLLDTVSKEITGMAETQTDQHVRATAWRLDGLINLLPVIDNHVNDAAEPNALGNLLLRMDKGVADLLTRGIDYDQLAKALLRNMAANGSALTTV